MVRNKMRPSRAATNRKTGYLSEMIGNWPTPTSTERSGTNPNTGKGEGLSKTVKMWPSPRAVDTGGMSLEGAEERMKNRKAEGKTTGGFNDLKKAVGMFPTPRAGKTTDEDEESWLARHAAGKVSTPPLALAARLWATPRVDDSKNNGSTSQQERHGPALNVQVKQMLPTASGAGVGRRRSWSRHSGRRTPSP